MVECVHHWVFPAPSGPTSIGTCKKCGEKQEAENHMDSSPIKRKRKWKPPDKENIKPIGGKPWRE